MVLKGVEDLYFFQGGWLVGGEPEGFDLIDGTVGGI